MLFGGLSKSHVVTIKEGRHGTATAKCSHEGSEQARRGTSGDSRHRSSNSTATRPAEGASNEADQVLARQHPGLPRLGLESDPRLSTISAIPF